MHEAAVRSRTNPLLVEADVSDAAAVDRMFDQVLDAYGRIDILINNAGIQIAADTELAVADSIAWSR
ncbi:MAG TPA: SDR family NAD(P)-dependent oxidoreductase [Pseudonocardiaceae bacterium]